MNQIKRLHDQHLHSSYSFDSKENIENYYKHASEIGCEYFVTTEHIEFDSVFNHQDWTVEFDSLKKDLEKYSKKYPNVIPLLGVEMGYRKDKLKEMDNLVKSEAFDVINMSIHDNGKQDYYMKKDFLEIGVDTMLEIYFNNAVDGVKTYKDYDVLSHIDYGFKTAYLVDNSLNINNYKHYLVEIFNEVVKNDKVLEINYKVQKTINNDQHLLDLLYIYKECGGTKLSLSSDAHFLEQLVDYYNDQEHYINLIKQAGFNELYYFINRKEYKFII